MPHIHSIKSNARRQARNEGLDPDICVHEHRNGGWYVAIPSAAAVSKGKPATKEPKTAKPAKEKKAAFNPRKFEAYHQAERAANSAVKRSGLKADAFTIVHYVGGYSFVPKHLADDFEIATPHAKPNTFQGPSTAAAKAPTAKRRRAGRKTENTSGDKPRKVLAMITAKGGASITEICKETGWLPHTARARISGIVKANKLHIERTLNAAKVSVYRAIEQGQLPLTGKAA